MYRHLFFDLDDTFWDVESNQRSALDEIFTTFDLGRFFTGFPLFYDTFKAINQRLWNQYRDGIVGREYLRNHRFVELLASAGIENEALAWDMSNEYLRVVPTRNRLLPYAVETLENLDRKGYAMSLITNGFNEVQFRKVENSGISNYFQRIVTSEFAGVNKPNPGIFEYALRKAGVGPSESVMIGDDSYNDIYGASAVGMDTIFYNPNRLTHEQRPTHEIGSLLELTTIL